MIYARVEMPKCVEEISHSPAADKLDALNLIDWHCPSEKRNGQSRVVCPHQCCQVSLLSGKPDL